MRKAWPVLLVAPALLLGCAGSPTSPAPAVHASSSPRLTVAMLRQAEFQRQAVADADELIAALSPTQGDVIGFGGSLLGDVAAGLPGGAALGFGGQMAGGNNVGKSVGSTFGALLGAILGPIGGVLGSIAGGFAGKEVHEAVAAAPWDDPGPVYIEGIDTGPLAAVSPAAAEPTPGRS